MEHWHIAQIIIKQELMALRRGDKVASKNAKKRVDCRPKIEPVVKIIDGI